MLRILLACFVCVSYVMCMTTTQRPHHVHNHNHTHNHSHHHTNTTREPPARESFKFIYESHSQMMVVVSAKECYVFALSDSEKSAIHTDAGLRAVELRLLSALSTTAVTTITRDQLDPKAAHACGGHATTFYKESSS
ncbi:uncharacterized protein LOC132728977 isoform X1 [Ruditapes philippinarum]|uniref:uncharacterized protein LOC132728977 isoform X1 n=2 Tax=Ruditapes philippinarum TaxID=129788 RepID=UPI00295B3F92|nr:uncharacterized protein LOC132728977 isoform X1 [Ruditapes philippinarum]